MPSGIPATVRLGLERGGSIPPTSHLERHDMAATVLNAQQIGEACAQWVAKNRPAEVNMNGPTYFNIQADTIKGVTTITCEIGEGTYQQQSKP